MRIFRKVLAWLYNVLKSLRLTMIVLGVILLFRWLLFEPYRISSNSMEGELMDGDYVLISKIKYGAIIPGLLKIPFVNYDNPFFKSMEIDPFVNFHTPHFRLPGVGKIEHGDVVTFFLPIEKREHTGLKTIYIKRCIGTPGDTISIRDWSIFRNGRSIEKWKNVQHRYRVSLRRPVETIAGEVGIKNLESQVLESGSNDAKTQYHYLMLLSAEEASRLESYDALEFIAEDHEMKSYVDLNLYPNLKRFRWNLDTIGPMVIPHRGLSIKLDKERVDLYGAIIRDHENLGDVKIDAGKIFVDGIAIDSYVFTKDYYYMVGDNRNASYDSRFWGFVPEDHILGRACSILYSKKRPMYGIFASVK